MPMLSGAWLLIVALILPPGSDSVRVAVVAAGVGVFATGVWKGHERHLAVDEDRRALRQDLLHALYRAQGGADPESEDFLLGARIASRAQMSPLACLGDHVPRSLGKAAASRAIDPREVASALSVLEGVTDHEWASTGGFVYSALDRRKVYGKHRQSVHDAVVAHAVAGADGT